MNLHVQHITSLDLPELQPYRTLRRPMDHIKQGIFVAEGEKVVRRLLASHLTVISMLLTPEWYQQLFAAGTRTQHSNIPSFQPFQRSRSHTGAIEQINVFIAEKPLLESIVGYNLHQGIMAVAKVPAERSLGEVVAVISKPHLLIALDGLVNAENVGVVVRNCTAFGVDAVIVGETSSSPYLRRAVRNSMGAVFDLSIVHATNLVGTLQELQEKHGTHIVAAHPYGSMQLSTSNLSRSVCIVFGNEGEGISQKVLDVCTERIAIPMLNETDSLNVASASAVFLYEARKQRG